MKKINQFPPRKKQIHSLKELLRKKTELQIEIRQTESDIRQDYQSLVDMLTFRNVITTIAEDVIAANTVVSQAYSIGKSLFKKRKKKKTKDE